MASKAVSASKAEKEVPWDVSKRVNGKMLKKFLILYVISVISFAHGSYAQENTCSKPRVAVKAQFPYEKELIEYLEDKYPSQPKESWLWQIREKVLDELRMNSPNIQFIPANGLSPEDCDYEFRYSVSPYGEDEFLMNSNLARKDACGFSGNLLYTKNNSDPDIFHTIERNINSYGSITSLIDEYERTHRVPPRGPEIQEELSKKYVSPELEERELDIRINVRNCRGEPVFDKTHGQIVTLPRKTERGELKPTPGFPQDYNMTENVLMLIITTEAGASATYTLKKGMEASEDPLRILTCGIDRKVVKEISVLIYGMQIEATPKDAVISPGETTQIEIYLFKYSPQGNKIPAANQSIDTMVNGLIDGSVSPRGKVITNEGGKVVLEYRAGEKDKRIDINAKYQPEGYPDFINAQTYVEVEEQKCWQGTVQMIVNSELDWEDEQTKKYSDGTIREIVREKIKHFLNYHIVVQFYFDRKNGGILLAKSVEGSSHTEHFTKWDIFGRCREREPWKVIDRIIDESFDERNLIDNIKGIDDVVMSIESIPGLSMFVFELEPDAILMRYAGTTYTNWKERQYICKGETEREPPVETSFAHVPANLPSPFVFLEQKKYESNGFGGEKTIIENESFDTTVRDRVPYTTNIKYIWAVWRTKCRK